MAFRGARKEIGMFNLYFILWWWLMQNFKVRNEGLLVVKPEAKEGKEDILDLWDFSEKSLLNTMRVRYMREEVSYGDKRRKRRRSTLW